MSAIKKLWPVKSAEEVKCWLVLCATTLYLCNRRLGCPWVFVSRKCPAWVCSVFFFTYEDFFHDQYPRASECLHGGSPRRPNLISLCHHKGVADRLVSRDILYFFALCLLLKSLSWLQTWWEVSQRACPQPPTGLRFALYPPSGLEGATGCWTWPWERNGSQKESRAWASCSPLPAGAGSVGPLTRVFRTLNRWLKHQYKSFQTSQKAKNLVWTPTEIFHSGAL